MTFDLVMWPLTLWTYEGFPILSININKQVWLQSDFEWGEFYIFRPSYNLTSDDLLTLVSELWRCEHMEVPIFYQ